MIGLNTGLVIVDTVNCKCLLVEVDEIDFMGELCTVHTEGTSVESTAFLGHETAVMTTQFHYKYTKYDMYAKRNLEIQ